VNQGFATLYDTENLTECDGEKADVAANADLLTKAFTTCILWQHHKWVKISLFYPKGFPESLN